MKPDSKLKKYIFNLLLTTVLGGVIGFLNYLFNIVIARYTSSEIFAIYGATIGMVYLLQIPSQSIQNIVTKLIGEEKDRNVSKFRIKSFIIFSIIGIVLGIVFQLCAPLVSNIANIPTYVIPSLSITLTLAFIVSISKGILLGREQIIKVNITLFIETLLRFGLGFLATKLNGNISLLILASTLPSFLTCIVILPMIKTNPNNTKDIRIPYKGILLMTVSLLLLSVPYTLDLILVPTELRAQYSALSLIGKVVYFAAITISAVMFARLSNQKSKKEELKTLGVTILLTSLIGIVMTAGLYLFQDTVIQLAFDSKYAEISQYFMVFGLSMTAYAIVFMLANFFFSQNSYMYMIVLLSTAVLQVILLTQRATDLNSVVQSQVVVYSVLLILSVIYLIFNFVFYEKIKSKKEVQKTK